MGAKATDGRLARRADDANELAEGGAARAPRRWEGAGPTGSRGALVQLWMSQQALCDELGISAETLDDMVRKGEVERSHHGDSGRVRLLDPFHAPRPIAPHSGPSADPQPIEPDLEARPRAALVELVCALMERVSVADRERQLACRQRDAAAGEARRLSEELARAFELVEAATAALALANQDRRRLHRLLEDLSGAPGLVARGIGRRRRRDSGRNCG